jgi:DNA-binding IclR family transcriptional regulator
MAAIDKALVVYTALQRSARPMRLSELSRSTGLAKSTTHRLLSALTKSGVVTKSGLVYSAMWRRGEAVSAISSPGVNSVSDLRRLAPFVGDLVAATRLTASLAVLSGADVVFAHRVYGHNHAWTPSDDSGVACADRTAAGRLLLSNNFRAACDVAYGQDMDVVRFYDELAQIKRRGFAISEKAEVTCIAVPLPTGLELPDTALTIKGATPLIDQDRILYLLRRVVRAAANEACRAAPYGAA